MKISVVSRVTDTNCKDREVTSITDAIKAGGKSLKTQIEKLRETILLCGKKEAAILKNDLPAVLWSGRFGKRSNDALIEHSGLLCADLDNLDGQFDSAREKLCASPHVMFLFTSPSGDGLKVVFKIESRIESHAGSFRAIRQHIKTLTDLDVDEACKDVARLCFLSYDPKMYENLEATTIAPAEEAARVTQPQGDLNKRQQIVTTLLGEIEWKSQSKGLLVCPGERLHSTPNGQRDCAIDLIGAPTVHCFHNSCRGILNGINRELRKLIWQEERQPAKNDMSLVVQRSLEHYERIHADKRLTGLRTGFAKFDGVTGGLKPSWLIIVSGETNVGKSSFSLNIVNHVLSQGGHVALFTFEMDCQEITDILFSRISGVTRNRFNTGYFAASDWGTLADAAAAIAQYKLDIYDDPTLQLADVEAICKEGEKLDLVVIDYLQIMSVSGYKDSREQQVAYLSRGCKAIAKVCKCPVIALSQLNDEGKLRESRAIGHDANCVIVLREDGDEIEMRVVKGRSIPKGRFGFDFKRDTCTFTETNCDERLEAMLATYQHEPR